MKKFAAVLLCICTMLATFSVAFAATTTAKITGVTDSIDSNRAYGASSISPGEVLEFPLTGDMFTWSDGAVRTKSDAVTKDNIDKSSLTIRTTGLSSTAIDSIEFKNKSFNGMDTMHVVVTFKDRYVSTGKIELKTRIFLALGSSRIPESELYLEGTFTNKQTTISNNNKIIQAVNTPVIESTTYIKDVQIEAGEGLFVTTRFFKDKYYIQAKAKELNSTHESLINKYDLIDIIELKTVNISAESFSVKFEDHEQLYVYDENGKYLGRSPSAMPLSSVYYITGKRFDSINVPGGSSTTTPTKPSTPTPSVPTTPSTPTPNTQTGEISTNSAKSATTSAITTAKSEKSTLAKVRFKDATSISAEALKAINTTANGFSTSFIADTMSGNSVMGRLTINPANATKLTNSIKLGVFVDSKSTSSVKTYFEKYFSNNLAVVSMAQSGSYGMTVRVAAKVDLSKFSSTNNIYIYTYDQEKNSYKQLTGTDASIDSAGYLHFNTSTGNYIIISDKALAKK